MNSQDSFGVWQHQGADEASQKRRKREHESRGIGPVIINSGSSPACVNNAADVRWCEIVAKQRPLRPTSPTGHWPKPGTVCKTLYRWITELGSTVFANWTRGCTETMAQAHGLKLYIIADLMRAGFTSSVPEMVRVGSKTIAVIRIRITDAGRQALAEP
jgi:hypothetical protein